jgi:hypothetical protein
LLLHCCSLTPGLWEYLRTLWTVFSAKTGFSEESDRIFVSTVPGSSVRVTLAFVHRSTPMAAPLPVAMAFIIVAAP